MGVAPLAAEVEGLDGVFIGPYDLSGSCGFVGQTEHADVTAACARVLAACRAHGKSAGLHVVMPDAEAIAAESSFHTSTLSPPMARSGCSIWMKLCIYLNRTIPGERPW